MKKIQTTFVFLFLVLLISCGEKNQQDHMKQEPTMLILGDSLTEGFRLKSQEAMPNYIQKKLIELNSDLKVVNAGRSGDTTLDALGRYQHIVDDYSDLRYLVIELGANDFLQDVPLQLIYKNIKKIITITKLKHPNAIIYLCAMKAWPKSGNRQASTYNQIFPSIAKEESINLIPFILEGIVGHPQLVQSDGLHPNSKGVIMMSNIVWKALEKEFANK